METATIIITVACAVTSVFALSWTPLGRSLVQRLSRPAAKESAIAAMRDEMDAALAPLRQEVRELAERLDFTERLLAAAREPGPEPGQQRRSPIPDDQIGGWGGGLP